MTLTLSLAPLVRVRRAPDSEGPAAPTATTGHVANHRPLLGTPVRELARGRPAGVVDAVVVPAARPAANLRHAARVADMAEATLVVMASRETDADVAREVVGRRSPVRHPVVVRVPAGFILFGLPLQADAMAAAIENRHVDTSAKRNAALALALMVGWRRILFLDDDVRGFHRPHLERLEAGFRSHPRVRAVGWAFDDFPDNSIVCHAHRRSGRTQGTFIGAGALAVQVSDRVPHFPRVYNEDWLFLRPLMRDRRVVLAGGLRQLRYDPFADPGRAARQEFGDVLAEGLFRHAHLKLPDSTLLRPGYWKDALQVRDRLIRSIRAGLQESREPETPRITACLDAADEVRGAHWAPQLAEYVRLWRQDAHTWRQQLAGLPRRVTIPQALNRLGLPEAGAVCPRRHRVAAQRWVTALGGRALNRVRVGTAVTPALGRSEDASPRG